MFWMILFLVCWYQTGLLCILFLGYQSHKDGEDLTSDDIPMLIGFSFLGCFLLLLLVLWVFSPYAPGKAANRAEKQKNPPRILIPGRKRVLDDRESSILSPRTNLTVTQGEL
jgi:hypothetical protein